MNRLLRIAAVLDIIGVSRSALYEWMNTGWFPRPIRVGPRTVRWRSEDIEAWLAECRKPGVAMIPRADTCSASPLHRAPTRGFTPPVDVMAPPAPASPPSLYGSRCGANPALFEKPSAQLASRSVACSPGRKDGATRLWRWPPRTGSGSMLTVTRRRALSRPAAHLPPACSSYIKGMFVLSYWSRCNIGSLTSKPGTSILEKLCIAILEGGKAWEGSRPPGGRPAPPDARADGRGPLVHAGSRPTPLSRAAVQVSVICRLSLRGPTFVSSRFRATRSGECGWLPGGGFEARHGASAFVASDAVLGARRPRRPRLRPPPCKPLRCALLTPVSVAPWFPVIRSAIKLASA